MALSVVKIDACFVDAGLTVYNFCYGSNALQYSRVLSLADILIFSSHVITPSIGVSSLHPIVRVLLVDKH